MFAPEMETGKMLYLQQIYMK